MAAGRPGFMVYFADWAPLDALDNAQFRAVFRAAFRYAQTGVTEPVEDTIADIALKMLLPRLDHDRERYEAIREKRRDAGKAAHADKCQQVPTYETNINPNVTPTINSTPNGNSSPMASPDPRITELERLKQKYAEEENEE